MFVKTGILKGRIQEGDTVVIGKSASRKICRDGVPNFLFHNVCYPLKFLLRVAVSHCSVPINNRYLYDVRLCVCDLGSGATHAFVYTRGLSTTEFTMTRRFAVFSCIFSR